MTQDPKKPRKPVIDVRDVGNYAKPNTLEDWQPRRPIPQGRKPEQMTFWEKHYYGRVDYPTDAKDYDLYCRWFKLVRRKEDAQKLGDEIAPGIDQELAYGDALCMERMAEALLCGHVLAEYRKTLKGKAEYERLEAEKVALEHARREKEKEWSLRIYERVKDCI